MFALFMLGCDRGTDHDLRVAAPEHAAAATEASAPAPNEFTARKAQLLVQGETAEISLASLPAEQPVSLELQLVEPSANSDPRPVRVFSNAGNLLELDGTPGDDRTTVVVEIPQSDLTPGRYVIEVRTTEKSHFPLRRYIVDVK